MTQRDKLIKATNQKLAFYRKLKAEYDSKAQEAHELLTWLHSTPVANTDLTTTPTGDKADPA